MADYQYQVDLNDPVAKLRLAMDKMDGELYYFPSMSSDYAFS